MNRTDLGPRRRHKGLLIVLAALLATSWRATAPAPVANAEGTTFTVNTTVDGVDANLGDRKCATASGACSLRATIRGTALWLRFHEVTGDAGMIGLVNPDDFTEGPAFAPGSDGQLEAGTVTVQGTAP